MPSCTPPVADRGCAPSGSCSTIVKGGLREEDPEAYAFMDALELTEEQIDGLEYAINKEEDPVAGARRWAPENREVVRPWIEAARNAR